MTRCAPISKQRTSELIFRTPSSLTAYKEKVNIKQLLKTEKGGQEKERKNRRGSKSLYQLLRELWQRLEALWWKVHILRSFSALGSFQTVLQIQNKDPKLTPRHLLKPLRNEG